MIKDKATINHKGSNTALGGDTNKNKINEGDKMENAVRGNLNSFGNDTTNNIELGADTMAKAIKDFYEFMHLDKPIISTKDGDYNGLLKGLFS